MELFTILLAIHITSGALGLVLGSVILGLKKGNALHKTLGKIFSIAMLSAGTSSLFLANMHPNTFLFAVGVFTIYLTTTGWRYLYLKNIAKGQKPIWIDWLLIITIAICSVWFIGKGVYLLISNNTFGSVLIVFGIVCALLIRKDILIYKGSLPFKNYWLTLHLQRMMGAYIASLTAFAVVNVTEGVSILAWLLPGALITPLIFIWSKKYGVKL
jgi:uncharacterized membrane protein